MTSPGNRQASDGPALANRVALIAGASGGIGQALGRRLAAESVYVALGYGSDAGPAMDLAAEVIASGGQAVLVQTDLRSPEASAELVAATEGKLGPVNTLVSNAGLGRRQPLEENAPCSRSRSVCSTRLRSSSCGGKGLVHYHFDSVTDLLIDSSLRAATAEVLLAALDGLLLHRLLDPALGSPAPGGLAVAMPLRRLAGIPEVNALANGADDAPGPHGGPRPDRPDR